MEARLIKNTQKATTGKWRQCNRLREKDREKREKGKNCQERNRENREME